jgi:hypothetical protein
LLATWQEQLMHQHNNNNNNNNNRCSSDTEAVTARLVPVTIVCTRLASDCGMMLQSSAVLLQSKLMQHQKPASAQTCT